MSDSRPPTLQRAWHAVMLLLLIAVSLWLIVWILTKIWLWIVGAVLLLTGLWVASLWGRHRRDKW